MLRGALLFLLIPGCLITVARADVSQQQVQKWVDESTLTFIGTIKEMDNSNVSGFDPEDSMIVQVDSVESGDQQALKKLDLKGSRLTVAVDPISRVGLQNNISALFFADPLIYGKNIGVIATAVPIPDSKEDFLNKLHAAAVRKSEAPLRTEIGNAELIVTGEVVAVRALAVDLGSIHNGWELFSEHRPRWKEAIIKVTQRVDKPEPKPDFVSVIFPATHDCFLGPSPKFQVKDSGIWLLRRNGQLDSQEVKVLIRSEDFNGRKIQTYTALHPADFQDISMLSKIQQIIAAR